MRPQRLWQQSNQLSPSPDDLNAIINAALDAAARETLPRFRQFVDVANKESRGFDPVTEADREAERVIREVIEGRFPDHGIVGEEFGDKTGSTPYKWIIDPIDGTRAFISGIPVWGTLLALYENDRPVAGAMEQPFTGERFLALDGQSTLYRQGQTTPLKTGQVENLEHATLMTTDPNLFVAEEDQSYFVLQSACQLTRYGCDCYAYGMLASGHVDLVVESGLNIYDIAALIPIIENAGGLVTDWNGGSAHNGGQILAAANQSIHRAAVDLLGTAQN